MPVNAIIRTQNIFTNLKKLLEYDLLWGDVA